MLQGDAAPESEKEKRISLLRVRKGRAAAVDEAAQAHEGALSQAQRAAEAESEAKRAAAEAKARLSLGGARRARDTCVRMN